MSGFCVSLNSFSVENLQTKHVVQDKQQGAAHSHLHFFQQFPLQIVLKFYLDVSMKDSLFFDQYFLLLI
jgi:hypothetical protein